MSEPASGEDTTQALAGFAEELRRSFHRRRPQGSLRWNFSGAFNRLAEEYGPARRTERGEPPAGDEAVQPAAQASTGPARSLLHRLADRFVTDRLRIWIDEEATAVATKVSDEGLARQARWVEEGFGTSLEAFRFLAARVELLEGATERREVPIDGAHWLVDPPDLAPWSASVLEWLSASHRAGTVLHAECGDGAFSEALASAGLPLSTAEPRGTFAWNAAERGLRVHLGSAREALCEQASGSLGGIVLSGVVDRSPVEELVGLVELASDRLAPGAPMAVVGTRPEAAAAGWEAVAHDLMPGRPLHAVTWQLLLDRHGFADVHTLAPPSEVTTYVVVGSRRR